ncbi:hypothetical protein MKZ17_10920 [Solibacillus sp. FSL R7-0682]|uniref:hypothetical protein n=1 Tax=Solibacillus sp. FSL R7-0682 TaxID=2921690 RepID=UPI0030FA2451
MIKQLKDKFPSWTKEKQESYYLSGTDDLDSLATMSILNQVFGYEQNMYVTRDGIYMLDTSIKNHIGVDLACLGDRYTYDNHVTLRDNKSKKNPNSANINSVLGITSINYHQKCAFSTLLQVMSLYDIPLPSTDEGKMFLLSIDSSHYGHYDSKYQGIHNNYIRQLGYDELINIMNKYTKEEISSMRMNEYLTFNNGYLTYEEPYKSHAEKLLGYELILPTQQFKQVAKLETNYSDCPFLIGDVTHDNMMFSCAFTGQSKLSYTKYKQIRGE